MTGPAMCHTRDDPAGGRSPTKKERQTMNTTIPRRLRAYESLIRLILAHGTSPRRRHRRGRKADRAKSSLWTVIRRLAQRLRG